jgi:polynucleotide 5'-kinase involved in rRNA processing
VSEELRSGLLRVPVINEPSFDRFSANHRDDHRILELERSLDIRQAQLAFKILPVFVPASDRFNFVDRQHSRIPGFTDFEPQTNHSDVWMFVGGPGSGKSTLFNYLTDQNRKINML